MSQPHDHMTDDDVTELFTLMDDNFEEPEWDMSPGSLTFFVIQSCPHPDPTVPVWKRWTFEFEYEDYEGCASWLNEGVGFDYFLTSMCDPREFKEGWTYTIHDITVHFTRGDGYTTDDDEDWEWGEVTRSGNLLFALWHKIKMIWWRNVTTPLLIWRGKRKP